MDYEKIRTDFQKRYGKPCENIFFAGKNVEFFQSVFSVFSCSKNNKFTPSSGTIHLILLISTPIERKRAFYRLFRAMRLAGLGRPWEGFGKIKELPFELISGVLGSWEIFFKLHSRERAVS
jgi:hypothetical protein